MNRYQLSRLKRANVPYIAEEVDQIMSEAPGAPPKPPLPPARKSRSNTKLELADAEIIRCGWCGAWALDIICTHCEQTGYPTIDDLGRTA